MSNDKLAEALRACMDVMLERGVPTHPDADARVAYTMAEEALQAHVADEAAQAQAQAAEPVAITKDSDDLYTGWLSWTGKELPPGTKLYTNPQPAQDASNPLKGWIFDKVDMGRGDERYICTPNGANATTVSNESTSDHRERMLWLIADAMAKESGNE